MALTTIVAINQTAGALPLDNIAVENNVIPASGQVTLTDFSNVFDIQVDEQLRDYVDNDQVLLGDGLVTFSKVESQNILTPVASSEDVGDQVENLSPVATSGDFADLSNSAHSSTHVRTGSDPIDADQLDITFAPANYTPVVVTETTDVTELSSHLAGIDDKFASLTALDVFEGYDAAGGTIAGSGTFTALPLDTQRKITVGFTHTPGTSDVTVNGTGTYLVLGRVGATNLAGGRTNVRARISANISGGGFNPVAGTIGPSYHRNATQGEDGSTVTAVLDLNAGDVVRLEFTEQAGGATISSLGDASSLIIFALVTSMSISGSPTGPAGGDLGLTYPNPTVIAVTPPSGRLTFAAIADGEVLIRSGGTITSTTISSGVTDHGALTGLADNDHPQYQLVSQKDSAGGYVGLDASSNAVVVGSVTAASFSTAGNITVGGTVDGRDVAVDGTKLDGIAPGATANQTDAFLLDRANHTGTQAASTITGLATVATSGDYNDLSNLPAALPPTGSAGGDLNGTYPNPTVEGLTETSGPASLVIGAILDGELLIRSGGDLVSVATGSVGISDHGALTGLGDNDHPQYQLRSEENAPGGYVGLDGSSNATVVGQVTAGSFDTAGNIIVGGTVDGRDVAADGTKLDGIESGATADQNASEVPNDGTAPGADVAAALEDLDSRVTTIENFPPARLVLFAQDLPITTVVGTTAPQTKVTTVATNLPAGLYKIMWSYGWNLDSASQDFVGRLLQNASAVGEDHRQEPKDSAGIDPTGTNQRQYLARSRIENLTAGLYTWAIEFEAPTPAIEASIWEATIEIWRVG